MAATSFQSDLTCCILQRSNSQPRACFGWRPVPWDCMCSSGSTHGWSETAILLGNRTAKADAVRERASVYFSMRLRWLAQCRSTHRSRLGTYQTSKCASGEFGSGCSVWSKGKVPSSMTISNTPPAHTSTSFPSYPIGFPSPPVGWLRLFMSSGDMYTGVLHQQASLTPSQTQRTPEASPSYADRHTSKENGHSRGCATISLGAHTAKLQTPTADVQQGNAVRGMSDVRAVQAALPNVGEHLRLALTPSTGKTKVA